jgi:hypothetical protein
MQELGLYDPATYNPSEQEVSLKDRLTSKLSPEQEKEYGLAPLSAPVMPMLLVTSRRK